MNQLGSDGNSRLESLRAVRHWWARLKTAVSRTTPNRVAAFRKTWRRSWVGGTACPWISREAEIVAKVAGVVTLSLWLKRLIEQFLNSKVLNESILRGEMSDVVRKVEEDLRERRARHGRRAR